ncbi:MAG TPA: lysine--tRNA ligase [Thermoplasmata archaeon]|nr:lysine--tRNA ligase [Thermoplasmata archaeon]
MTHWYDELLQDAKAYVGGKQDLVINGGLSVSGLQHVGRLRGEITLAQLLTRSLRDEGRKVIQSLVLYTQDEWKSKEGQLSQFPGDEGKRYIGRRLIDVPDPKGCHKDWVDHYWQDFGGVLDRFIPDIRIVTTTDAYRNPEMQAVVRDLVSRSEEVRAVVNKYRARHPYPKGWLPFEAFCESCGKIGAKTLALEGGSAVYECPKCGAKGRSSIEKGKLNWRLEWAALWKVYRVDIEPFGKDHATPGGSRDSCKEVCETLLRTRAPMGIPYEWVGLADRGKDLGDMGSSDFIGFTPAQWVDIGDPEVLRYVYAWNPIFRRVVLDLSRVDSYHDTYDMAESAFYSEEREGDEEDQARSYELAQLQTPPEEEPFGLSYRHASFLAQISPEKGRLAWCLRRMRDTGMLDRELTDFEEVRVDRRLQQSLVWVTRYAPENRVALLEFLTPEVERSLDDKDREALRIYAERAAKTEWNEEAIKDSMVSLTKLGKLPVETSRFFRDLYLVLLGQERGPRAAPFLAVLEKDWVVKRLRDASR